MKIKHSLLLLWLLFAVKITTAQNQWVWLNGDQFVNTAGTYGEMGVEAVSNSPGSRAGACTWADNNGNLWMFGGSGVDEGGNTGPMNDLWKYNTSTHSWTWMGGSTSQGNPGTYDDKGTASPTNQPGARLNAVSWVDGQGNFWLFGGEGFGSESGSSGLLNDLWSYSPATGQWTWRSGTDQLDEEGTYSNRNEASTSNNPGGRSMAVAFNDPDGNLWLFGGNGYSSNSLTQLNDLWKYSPADETWTWTKGDKGKNANAHYGKRGEFANPNTPGGRQGSTGWTDSDGNFWLFGGSTSSGLVSDLWKFDRTANEWAWMNGDDNSNRDPQFTDKGSSDPDGNPGGRTLATGFSDEQGNLWLFGGSGYGGLLGQNPLNSLWKYTVSSNEWTFVAGNASILPLPVYGTQGVAAPGNQPGGHSNPAGWKDPDGNFWIFGGQSKLGYVNQTWKFSITCGGIVGAVSPSAASICEGGSLVLTATGGTTYEWSRNDEPIVGETGATITITEPGTYKVLITNGHCSGPSTSTAVITRASAPTGNISPASASICEGESQILTASGGTSYEWQRNGTTIAIRNPPNFTVTEPGTYSVIITNGTCSGPASNKTVITQIPKPTGTISPATTSFCQGKSQVLTATGGTSYQWLLDGQTIEGETGGTITVTQGGTYSAVISNGICEAPASNEAVVTVIPVAGGRYTEVFVSANVPKQLSATPAGDTYTWTPATGLDNPSSPTPTVTTSTDIRYLVQITSGEECPLIDTVQVKVAADTRVFIPTAFTPNGNNVNDVLRPLGNLSAIDYFKVYNRWGMVVFQTNVLGKGWDGRFKGTEQPADTYTWILSGKTQDGQPVKKSGKTLLIR